MNEDELNKDELNDMWKAVDSEREGAEKAMAILHSYILKMKDAVIHTHELENLPYPDAAKGSNFDDLRINFNGLLRAFNEWGECKELNEISL